MFHSRIVVAAASAALIFPAAAAYANQPARQGESNREPGSNDLTVTLITGDQVILPGGEIDGAWVQSGEGRDDVIFDIDTSGDGLRVIPDDAVELLVADRVDPRLFDVGRLVDYGYDDIARDNLPIIAGETQLAPTAGLLDGLLQDVGVLVTDTLSALDMSTAEVSKDDAEDLWDTVVQGGIDRLWLDGKRRPMLDDSVPQIRAGAAHSKGLDGSGVTVAVLDTGIDTTHPDLKGKVAKTKNFTKERGDQMGHGTHVASILAGSGSASDGLYSGVAPGVRLLNAKVCSIDACSESSILAGMQWATVDEKARVVNFSLGDDDEPGVDPLEEATNRLTKKTGALFVAAAGNGARDGVPVISPASADAALAVGAVDDRGRLASFSARGPRVGDGALKPDITAPGVAIVAAKAKGVNARRPVGTRYQRINGTSMATPHVSGAAAILAQAHPTWKAKELKAALMQSARPNPSLSPYEQGAGLVDIAAALKVSVLAEPASVEVAAPRQGGSNAVALTYRNLTGNTAIVRLSVTDVVAGETLPASDVARVRDRSLVIPAHRMAKTVVVVTAADGNKRYMGHVTARVGRDSIATPLVIEPS